MLEVTARKPGNVHRFADRQGLHFLDLLLSALAIAEPLDQPGERSVGATVLAAVEATRLVVSTNTNLGIILLLAPLAAVPLQVDLAQGVERVLAGTTIEDARAVYLAIRLAAPGGLGRASEQDVAAEPTVTLRQAMALAAQRDLVARQYANGFQEVLTEALPTLRASLREDARLETAIVTTYLSLLARHGDSLILRKSGPEVGRAVSRKAGEVLDKGWPKSEASRALCEQFDTWLHDQSPPLNPGTTADLITATLFAALRDGTIPLPRQPGSTCWSEP
jgi:triphosphoribosyl-dephospho-CoA synthase